MDARMRKDDDVHIIQIFGRLTYEGVETFAQVCDNHLLDQKVVFNFDGLSFVGSSGISCFMDTLKKLSSNSKFRPKFCGLSSEYRKILSAHSLESIDVFDSEFLAIRSFSRSGVFVEDMQQKKQFAQATNNSFNSQSHIPQAVGAEEPIGRAYPSNIGSNQIKKDSNSTNIDSIVANYIPFSNTAED